MTTGEYIQHLDKTHDYDLLQCAAHCTPESDCDPERCRTDHHDEEECFVLPSDFLFHQDAIVFSDERMGTKHRKAMPRTTLIDYRKTDTQKRWQQAKFSKHKITKFSVEKPARRRVKRKSMAAPSSSTSTSAPLLAGPVVTAQFMLRRCLADVATDDQTFAAIDTEMLVDSGLSVEQLSRTTKARMPNCDFVFTVSLHKRFTTALKAWLLRTVAEDFMEMLIGAFPGVAVPPDLASKMLADNLSVYDFLECSVEEVREYGIAVEGSVWDVMKTTTQTWMETRAATAEAGAADVETSAV
jgi:hypothetical protein